MGNHQESPLLALWTKPIDKIVKKACLSDLIHGIRRIALLKI